MGIFTGDFVFVGSIGRPDLLEEAAGLMGTAEPVAVIWFQSAQRFKTLPDYLQVCRPHSSWKCLRQGTRCDSFLDGWLRKTLQSSLPIYGRRRVRSLHFG